MKKSTNNIRLGDILFGIGLALIILQAIVLYKQLNSGALTLPMPTNLATFIYCLSYWFGYLFVGIIGVVMTIIGIISMNKSEKK